MLNCKTCAETFASEKSLIDHCEFAHAIEHCYICGLSLGEHSCIGKGMNGIEINFCLKNSNTSIPKHIPHPRMCEKCQKKHETHLLLQIGLDNDIADLEDALQAKRAERAALMKKISAAQDTRIKLFCGHGFHLKHCEKCSHMWDSFDAERERKARMAIDEIENPSPKPKPLTKREKATFVVLPKLPNQI